MKKSKTKTKSEYSKIFSEIYKKNIQKIPKKKVCIEKYDTKDLQKVFKQTAKDASQYLKNKRLK